MDISNIVKNEIIEGIKNIKVSSFELNFVTMSLLDDTLEDIGWISVGDLDINGWEADYTKCYCNPIDNTYIRINCSGYYGNGKIELANEAEELERLDSVEMQELSKQLNSKSETFIKILKQKENIEAKEQEELRTIMSKTMKLIDQVDEMIQDK